MQNSSSAESPVLILAGPTASGKTELAIELAQKFNAEIVSADSRQIYRGMPIGTAAPSAAQLAAVPHHLIGFLDPLERYSAARFTEDAVAAIEAIHARGKRAIVAGGTGFYIRALTGAVELAPPFDEDLRARLAIESKLHDSEFLHEWLLVRDPRRAAAISPADRYRIVRALEIVLAPRGASLRQTALPTLKSLGVPFLKLALEVDRPTLEERIARRTDAILRNGFVGEAERIGESAVAANAVGYPDALSYLRGWSTHDELREQLVRKTRRYAKRQQTWFRSEPELQRVAPAQVDTLAREMLGWV